MLLIKNINLRKVLSMRFTIIILLVLFSLNSYSQNKKTLPPAGQNTKVKNISSKLTKTKKSLFSEEETKINQEIELLRKSVNSDSENKIYELRKRSNEISRNSVTFNSGNNNGNSNFRKVSNKVSDNVTRSDIFTGGYLVASAIQTEQTGATAGKIWLLIAVGQADTGIAASGDSLMLYNSVDNGATFSLFTTVQANTGIKVNRDELDMEIIENSTGTKYLHVTLGYTTGGYFGDKIITLLTFDDAGNLNENALSIPGYSVSSDYFRPRITSDNSVYPSNAYVTVTFMQDSIDGPDHYLMSKMYRLYNPYSLNPAITYFPESIYSPVASLSNDFKAQTDIAYFNNFSDSLIFVLSAYPGYGDGVYIYKSDGTSNVYPAYEATLGSAFAGDEIENARVASNGGFNNGSIMITYSDNYFNISDFDQWAFSTDDASNWSTFNIDYSGNFNSLNGDIIGKRNTSGCFNIAFNNNNSCIASVASAEIRNNSIFDYVFNLNDNSAFSFLHPKPALRNVSNDSALTIWGSYYSLYATGGSNAIRVNITSAIEGLFDEGISNHVVEYNYSAYLRNSVYPYNIVDSAFLKSYSCDLNNAVIFNNAPDGDYYIAVKHRNTIETWSATPLTLTNGSAWSSYNFVSSDANSYGNNSVQKGSYWCFYSGDVDQDGIIDATDLSTVENDASISLTGDFLLTDLNGDLFVDASDVSIVENNIGVTSITP